MPIVPIMLQLSQSKINASDNNLHTEVILIDFFKDFGYISNETFCIRVRLSYNNFSSMLLLTLKKM